MGETSIIYFERNGINLDKFVFYSSSCMVCHLMTCRKTGISEIMYNVNLTYIFKLLFEIESVLYSLLFKFPFPTVTTVIKILGELFAVLKNRKQNKIIHQNNQRIFVENTIMRKILILGKLYNFKITWNLKDGSSYIWKKDLNSKWNLWY